MPHSKVIIIDYGSQVTQLIARRVREAGVYSEIHSCVTTAAAGEDDLGAAGIPGDRKSTRLNSSHRT